MKYILSIDQGTTSTRALLYDKEGKFKWANNNSKLKCVSYYDGTKIF